MKSNKLPKWEADTTMINFTCDYAVYREGGASSLCYATSKERAEYIAERFNKLENLERKIEKEKYKKRISKRKKR